jgi:hypothetical protein
MHKSPYTTLRTQNQFTFTQHSSGRFQSTFPTEVDEYTITGLDVPWPAVRDHMEKDLIRLYRPTFMIELSDTDMDWRYVSPYAAQRVSSVVNMPSQCARQKFGVPVKGESPFHAEAGTVRCM